MSVFQIIYSCVAIGAFMVFAVPIANHIALFRFRRAVRCPHCNGSGVG